MAVLFNADPVFKEHLTGTGHPERPSRIDAVTAGIERHHLSELLVPFSARPSTDEELLAVHTSSHLEFLRRMGEAGGGFVDQDTSMSERSEELARLGSGAVLNGIELLQQGNFEGAFAAVRPPGHHATPDTAMGFCLYNHVAVAAASLVRSGHKVLVADIDAHHGNGTQDVFFDNPGVLYVSWHESPMYPFTGFASEVGAAAGFGTTVNLPLPAGATGEHYRESVETIVAPVVEAFGADWLIISAGFDAHRADPLCNLALTSADIGDLVADLIQLVPSGNVLAVMEGGYDLDAIADSAAATLAALGGIRLHPEPPTSGGPGAESLWAIAEQRNKSLG
jgi:acetoin utilization deacetylase AcuC-like enzyme